MEAAGRVLGPKRGTGGVPCSVTLILSGGRAKRRTSCHSHHSLDVLLQRAHTHTPLQRGRGLFLVNNEKPPRQAR